MDNHARLDFITTAVEGLGLEDSDAEAALIYQLANIPSVAVDVDGTVSFTAKAVAINGDLSTTSLDEPSFDGG